MPEVLSAGTGVANFEKLFGCGLDGADVTCYDISEDLGHHQESGQAQGR
jgi:hypothetical protein